MTKARKNIVIEGEDNMYHCISRCVRKCFLCGKDFKDNKDYEHRKKWVQDRLKKLSEIFCIDILGFAIMSNHLHILLKVNHKKIKLLDDEDIVTRWRKLYPKSAVIEEMENELLLQDKEKLRKIKMRLVNISWFMKSISEYIAKKANKEDGCKGRFWEGRFVCKRIYDEASALQCALYIDLNPIRAKVSNLPEKSIFTSAYERIKAKNAKEKLKKVNNSFNRQCLEKESKRDSWLLNIDKKDGGFLPISLSEYLVILDIAGRELKKDKRGNIPQTIIPILKRLKINSDNWIENLEKTNGAFSRFMGSKESMRKEAFKIGQKWFRGISLASKIFIK